MHILTTRELKQIFHCPQPVTFTMHHKRALKMLRDWPEANASNR